MKNYKSIIFKIAQEERKISSDKDIKIGDVFKWMRRDNSSTLKFGDLFEIKNIQQIPSSYSLVFSCKMLTGDSKDEIRDWRLDVSVQNKEIQLNKIEPEKPHEYSPVQMTGRYKTIGD